ncbi:GNAT family N-acetyltransferase [Spongiimicrobium sp. 2-473A-2-J]|uniref:GNAT family N-acetyltransferase n=1 Tax=Eudoraea algarum TaxID=3417568 RepID=UPI003D35FBB8
MKNVLLHNIPYSFISDFKHNKDLRTSFNELTEVTFGFTLEEWYLDGYWGAQYIPYALLHGNKVISNVSVTIIEFLVGEEKKVGIQIGTVMTDKAYRNRGLSKFLMEQVLEEWKKRQGFIYLFANDRVLDFYPKFNFEKVAEYSYSKTVHSNSDSASVKKLNMDDAKDKAFLVETMKMAPPIAKISMRDNVPLLMFYCLWIKKSNIYYIDELEAIVIADFDGDTLYLNDVFSRGYVHLNDVVRVMSGNDVKRVVLGFTPLDETDYDKSLIKEEDTLFILKDKVDDFKDQHWMFPVLSHA